MVLKQHTARDVFQEDPFKAETIAAALQLLCSDEQLESLRLNANFGRGLPNSDKRCKEVVRLVRECIKDLFPANKATHLPLFPCGDHTTL